MRSQAQLSCGWREGLGGDLLVIVKGHSDITPEEEAEAEATERLYQARRTARADARRRLRGL